MTGGWRKGEEEEEQGKGEMEDGGEKLTEDWRRDGKKGGEQGEKEGQGEDAGQ